MSPQRLDDWADAYAQLVSHLPHETVMLYDAGQRVVLAAGAQLAANGYDLATMPGRLLSDVFSAPVWDRLQGPMLAALRGESVDVDHVASATLAVLHLRTRPVLRDGAVVGALMISDDVTAEREAAERLVDAEQQASAAHAFSSAVLAASPDIVAIIDVVDDSVVWASRSLMGVLGWTTAEVETLGSAMLDVLVHVEDRPRVRASNLAVQALPDGEAVALRYRIRAQDGTTRWMSRRLTPFARDASGAVTQGLSVTREITDVVVAEEQLRHSALHDPLTGLPNRALLTDRLAGALARAAHDGTDVALLFCDLDGFKRVNDTAGHRAGDQLLVEIADRIRTQLQDGDTVARVGGDEFVVILEPSLLVPRQRSAGHADAPVARVTEQDARARAVAAADRIRRAVHRPVVADGVEHTVSVSIGVTLSRPGSTADDLLRDSDTAMYRAKERGKNRHEVFDEGLRAHVLERGRVERTLRAVLSGLPTDARLAVAYQPVRDLRTSRVVACEALCRLTDQHGDAISPEVFIDVAEDTGLIHELGRFVLHTALDDLARWRTLPGGFDLTVAVNVSARQAQQSDIAALVLTALADRALPPSALTLELTESVLLQAGPSTLRQMTDLHEAGIRIAIDDFGTGYASLRYLATLPVSQVKVDRSFVSGLPGDPTSVTIVRAVVGLARDLGLECVAEGIETPEQRAALPPGVLGQGWLLGRPGPAHALDDLLGAPAVRR